MELLYIWIDSYKNIHKQGFNFSPKHRFDFVPTSFEKDAQGKEIVTGGNLTCTEHEFPDNFFGERISNVTAIVGENGSGKSSLLKIITGYMIGNFFLALRVNKDFRISQDWGINDINNSFSDNEIIIISKNVAYINHCNNKKALKVIYLDKKQLLDAQYFYTIYSNNSINNTQIVTPSLSDISNNYFLSKLSLNNLQIDDTRKQMIFFYKNNDVIQKIFNTNNNNIYLKIKIKDELFNENYLENMEYFKNVTDFKNIEDYLSCIYVNYLIEDTLSNEQKYSNIIEENIQALKFESTKISEQTQTIENYIAKFRSASKIKSKLLLSLKSLLNFVRKYKKTYFNKQTIILNVIKDINIAEELFNMETEFFLNFLTFSWTIKKNRKYEPLELSTGENNLISLFSRLYDNFSLLQSQNLYLDEGTLLLLLIDEGELGLHPQWQKEYLKNLIDVLPQIFKGKTIQIILTSHSPFLVSDLPKENIIFLEKEKKNEKEKGFCKVSDLKNHAQTFGQNIHTLFADSFFMDKNGGLMGEFAKNKLQKLIDYINDTPNEVIADDKTAQQYIDLIGEPILQRQLQKKLLEKQTKNLAKSQKIELLEQLLAQAKNDSH